MRIVGGTLSGRRFLGPQGPGLRPSPERLREALSSALDSRGLIEGARVLDLFAGTGAISFELLSRGAQVAVAVDRDKKVLRQLSASAASLGLAEAGFSVIAGDILGPPAPLLSRLSGLGPFDIVFADPPYAEVASARPFLSSLHAAALTQAESVLVLEHPSRAEPEPPVGWAVERTYRFGDSGLLLLSREPAA